MPRLLLLRFFALEMVTKRGILIKCTMNTDSGYEGESRNANGTENEGRRLKAFYPVRSEDHPGAVAMKGQPEGY